MKTFFNPEKRASNSKSLLIDQICCHTPSSPAIILDALNYLNQTKDQDDKDATISTQKKHNLKDTKQNHHYVIYLSNNYTKIYFYVSLIELANIEL